MTERVQLISMRVRSLDNILTDLNHDVLQEEECFVAQDGLVPSPSKCLHYNLNGA